MRALASFPGRSRLREPDHSVFIYNEDMDLQLGWLPLFGRCHTTVRSLSFATSKNSPLPIVQLLGAVRAAVKIRIRLSGSMPDNRLAA